MKVIFLDIDEVLQPESYRKRQEHMDKGQQALLLRKKRMPGPFSCQASASYLIYLYNI